jgi:hypothetical protein
MSKDSKYDTRELLLDMIFSVLDTNVVEGPQGEDTNETFIKLMQRLCLGTTLPKARTPQQFKNLEDEKNALRGRLTSFYKVLDSEARLKHLEAEERYAKEMHTVLLRQNIILVDHCTSLEFKLAEARKHISEKQQAAGAFRRACEAIA